MTITADPEIRPGVNHVTMTLVSGTTTREVRTKYNPAQGEFCIRRAARRLKMEKIDSVTIKLI